MTARGADTSAARRAAYRRLWSLGAVGDQLALDPGPFPARSRPERRAKRYTLAEGELLRGIVAKLPTPSEPFGCWLVLAVEGRYLALPAVARRGWTLLERALVEQEVALGDSVEIVFAGWRESSAGRRYRLVRVEVLARADVAEESAYLRYEAERERRRMQAAA